MKKQVSNKNVSLEKVSKKVDNLTTTVDNLAVITARGFDSVNKNIENTKYVLNNRINGLERRIDDLALNRSTRDEMRIIDMRLSRVEKQIGLKK